MLWASGRLFTELILGLLPQKLSLTCWCNSGLHCICEQQKKKAKIYFIGQLFILYVYDKNYFCFHSHMPGSQLDGPLFSPFSLPLLSWGLAVISCWLKWSWTTCFSQFSCPGLAVPSCYFVQGILLLFNHSDLNRRRTPSPLFSPGLISKLYPDISYIYGGQHSPGRFFLIL